MKQLLLICIALSLTGTIFAQENWCQLPGHCHGVHDNQEQVLELEYKIDVALDEIEAMNELLSDITFPPGELSSEEVVEAFEEYCARVADPLALRLTATQRRAYTVFCDKISLVQEEVAELQITTTDWILLRGIDITVGVLGGSFVLNEPDSYVNYSIDNKTMYINGKITGQITNGSIIEITIPDIKIAKNNFTDIGFDLGLQKLITFQTINNSDKIRFFPADLQVFNTGTLSSTFNFFFEIE